MRVKGTIFVVLEPKPKKEELYRTGKAVPVEDQYETSKLLFDLEQWLNGEITLQAYEKFKVGLRVHIGEVDI